MIRASLFDQCFKHQNASTFGGDRTGENPKLVEWVRNDNTHECLPVAFFTDLHLDWVSKVPEHVKKIAWLIEPPSLSTTHYKKAVMYEKYFDHILTFDKSFIKSGEINPKWLYYPFGGSWIKDADWGFDISKPRFVSLIASDKRGAPGHIMRHRAAQLRDIFPIDVMGHGYGAIESKTTGLLLYRYSIVTESVMCDDYFSEKLIDCFSTGTIPIYWGTKSIGNYFNSRGIIEFQNIDDLVNILVNTIGASDYIDRLDAIADNLERAKQYVCAEDWICKNYPFLFEGK